jgi:hypothetical protein
MSLPSEMKATVGVVGVVGVDDVESGTAWNIAHGQGVIPS